MTQPDIPLPTNPASPPDPVIDGNPAVTPDLPVEHPFAPVEDIPPSDFGGTPTQPASPSFVPPVVSPVVPSVVPPVVPSVVVNDGPASPSSDTYAQPEHLVAPPWTTVSFWVSMFGIAGGFVVTAALTFFKSHITIPDSVIASAATLLSGVLTTVYTQQSHKTARAVAGMRAYPQAMSAGSAQVLSRKSAVYRG